MDAKKLIELRKEAEKAVADMQDGELKVKAFEVILSHLMRGTDVESARATIAPQERAPTHRKQAASARSLTARILVLVDEGFFRNQRTIGQLQEELRAHGWHYPMTTLSGNLQTMTQRRVLRRIRGKEGKKGIWKYSAS